MTSDGFVQGYNCQLAVDSANQIIVAHSTQNEAGRHAAAARNDRPDQDQHRAAGGRALRGCGVPLRGEPARAEAPPHPPVHHHRTAETQRSADAAAKPARRCTAITSPRPRTASPQITTPPRLRSAWLADRLTGQPPG